MKSVEDPYGDGEYDKHDQHDEAERAHEVAEHSAEGVSEEIAGDDETPSPQTGGETIQYKKPLPMNRAQPHRKGGEISDPIDEAEREDEAGVISLEPIQGRFDAIAPFREAIKQPQPEIPADPKIGLISGEAAEPGGCEQQRRVEQALGCGEGGK